MNRLDIAKRDRAALSGLFNRLRNMSPVEYNALIHAIWRLDREINEGVTE